MELKIPIEIVFDDVNSVIDELGELQKYKLCEDDDMTLVDVDDVSDVLTRHVMAREAKEPCGTKEGYKHDLVEAVRCKDCKFWQDQEEGVIEVPICARPENKYEKLPFRFMIGKDGFCSFAERRSDEQ